MSGPTCCQACRDDRTGGVGHARRWALTDKGYAALGQVNVPIPSRAELQQIAEHNRKAR